MNELPARQDGRSSPVWKATCSDLRFSMRMTSQKNAIAPLTTVGPAALTIADLDGVADFYETVIGLNEHRRDGEIACLGAGGDDLLILDGDCSARPPGRCTGLFHLAILVPSRLALAQALRRIVDSGHPLQGASNHLVSEALYLADPEGNGIEIYRDTPRDTWRWDGGQVEMATEPLDLRALLSETSTGERPALRMPADSTVGHVHLRVADIPAAEAFYQGLLGFDITARYGPAVTFLSAGGYHHHIGINTWGSLAAPSPAPGSRGLRHFSIRLPDRSELQRLIARLREAGVTIDPATDGVFVRDPSGNGVLLTAHGQPV